MIWWHAVLGLSAFLVAVPALLYFRNTQLFRPPPPTDIGLSLPEISALIPARNEEESIAAAVKSVLANRNVNLEVIVLDDHSTDATANIVREISSHDPRVRVVLAPPLPDGWCGKQHACYALSQLAKYPILTFLDADVRLEPDALARMIAFQKSSQADLVSGFPKQETGTLLEKLIIPLIHWLLLSFLPFDRMRKDLQPGLGAGCGQWFLTTREAYDKTGGHSAIRASLHDGVKLPRAYRTAGLMTDLCDVTDLATCRMYHSAGQVWNGLAKNAQEGLGSAKLIVPMTLLVFSGQVLPCLLWVFYDVWNMFDMIVLSLATVASFAPRIHAAIRFRQSWLGAMLHPMGVTLLLMIQWYSLFRSLIGQPIGWKGRVYSTSSGATHA